MTTSLLPDPLDLGEGLAALHLWYASHRRALPWRDTNDPWAIWVSEVMLQQTRVETVLRYFDAFLQRFPDPGSLARATEDEALKAWEGMGYYARCRLLRQAAGLVVERYGGRIPERLEDLLTLPGIGRSTAGAILSFAFGRAEAVLDANVRRVLVRVLDLREDPFLPGSQQRLWGAATRWVRAARDPALQNQAMMEVGALVCRPRDPLCPSCPLASCCLARARGSAQDLPIRRRGRQIPEVKAAVMVIRDPEGRVFVQRRPSRGLLGGLWEFPGGKIAEGETPREAALREVEEETGFRPEEVQFLCTVRHAYTHFRVVLHAFEGKMPEGGRGLPVGPSHGRWVLPEEIASLAIPGATRKVLHLFLRSREGLDLREEPLVPRRQRTPSRADRAVQPQPKRKPIRS